jgi:uncharacterized OB-fold protein
MSEPQAKRETQREPQAKQNSRSEPQAKQKTRSEPPKQKTRWEPVVRPAPDRDSAPWWDAVRRHELTIQRCAGCGTLRFPARVVCNRCRSREADWVPSCGTGRVVSWIVNHQRFLPGMPADGPFAVLFVRLDDGTDDGADDGTDDSADDGTDGDGDEAADGGADLHMYGNLVDADPSEITPGMRVEAVFVDIDDNLTLVQWRPKG